jgi:hypothetical protein
LALQALSSSVGSFATSAFVFDDLDRLLVCQIRVLAVEVLNLITARLN